MKKVFKTVLKGIVILLTLITIALIVIPAFFEDDIMIFAKEKINEQVNAEVNFESLDLSLIRNFPNVAIDLNEVSIINKAPFEGDTLFYADNIALKLSISALWSNQNDPYDIQYVSINNAVANVISTKQGIANYDITIPSENITETTEVSTELTTSTLDSKPLKFNLHDYSLNNLRIVYWDQAMNLKLQLEDFTHTGSGDFTTTQFNLKTTTETKISFDFEGTNYLNKNFMGLYATLGIDLDENKYTFLKNKFVINALELNFDGFIQLIESGQLYDLTFNTPSTSFLSFLEMIPKKYTKSLEGIETNGEFSMSGKAKGVLDSVRIPAFSLDMTAKNAMFKYPDLPKAVQNIQMETHIKNDTGILDNTFVDIRKFQFTIDKDRFKMSSQISNVIKNPKIKANFNGDLDLENITKAYPVPLDDPISGHLNLAVKAAFDIATIDKKEYEKTNINGLVAVSNFEYTTTQLPHPIEVKTMKVNFTPKKITLDKFDAKSGESDFKLNGRLDNLLGFVFKKEPISAKLKLESNQFRVDDFVDMSESTAGTESQTEESTTETISTQTSEEPFKIPSFLDCTFDSKIKKVVYDDITLSNFKGYIIIKNQEAILKNLSFNLFKGKIALSGLVNTKTKITSFNSKMSINRLDINDSFTKLKALEKILPIANSVDGLFSSKVNISGVLNPDYTPDTNSLSGNMNIQFINGKFKPKKSEMLTSISESVSFINFNNASLDDIKIYATVKNGKVNIKPFNFKHEDIIGTISGTHGFDQSIDYKISANIPARHLGGDVNSLLEGANDPALKNIKVPVGIGLTGNFSKPKVRLDVKSAMKKVKDEAVRYAKRRAKEEVKREAKKQLGSIIDNAFGGSKDTDKKEGDNGEKSTKEQLKEKGKELLNNIFGN